MSPRVTLRSESSSIPHSIYILFTFFPFPFLPSLLLLSLFSPSPSQGARSPWALIFHEARPKETDLSLVCHRVIYTALEEREFVRQKRARRGTPPDITSFRLLHRIDHPHHHRLPTVDSPSLSFSRDYRLLRGTLESQDL